MTDAELRAQIKQGPRGGYLLCGEESYLIRSYAGAIADAVLTGDATFDAFNRIILAGDAAPGDVEAALLSMPMMSDRVLVEWKDPETAGWNDETVETLCRLFADLRGDPSHVLVIAAESAFLDIGQLPKRPSALYRKLSSVLQTLVCDKVGGDRLIRWAGRHLLADRLSVTDAVLRRVIAVCGQDMRILAGELDKLAAYVLADGRTEVTAADVDAACSPTSEVDAFELANAITSGNRKAALRALYVHKMRREEPIALLSSVARVMTDLLRVARLRDAGMRRDEIASALSMHSYKCGLYLDAASSTTADVLADAVRRCMACDEQMKSYGAGYEPLERLLCSLPGGRRG